MATRTDTFDLGALRLTAGEGRHLDLELVIEPFELGGHTYTVAAAADKADADAVAGQIPARLDISRMTGSGYALRLGFDARLNGPCMRCLEPATPAFHVDAREVSQPGEDDDEFVSPYVLESILDITAWARDALSLALPSALLHDPDCLGLCPVCGANLNTAGPEHHHDPEPDPRWAVLSQLNLEAVTPDGDAEPEVTPPVLDAQPEVTQPAEAAQPPAPEPAVEAAPEADPGTATA
jgi:uncharacterized protein